MNSDSLLALTFLFEKRAILLLKRAQSVVEPLDSQKETPKVPFNQDLDKTPVVAPNLTMPPPSAPPATEATIISGFRNDLAYLLNKPISFQDVSQWLEKNKSVLGDRIYDEWSVGTDPEGITYLALSLDSDTKIYVRIYAVADFTSFKPKSSAILLPVGNIPKLWIVIGTRTSGLEKLDPILSQDAFIVVALSTLFEAYPGNKAFQEKAAKFIKDNTPALNKIKKFFTLIPRKLGAGVDGVAFAISPNLVIKIHKSEFLFHEAQKSMKRLHAVPDLAKTEAMIYDAGTIGTFVDMENLVPIYYTIMELMKPVTDMNRYVQTYISYILDKFAKKITAEKAEKWKILKEKFKENISDSNTHTIMKDETLKAANEMADTVKKELPASYFSTIESKIPNLRSTWLSALAEEFIMKYLTSRTDLHIGNLGVTNYGEFRYFDPAWALRKSEFPAII